MGATRPNQKATTVMTANMKVEARTDAMTAIRVWACRRPRGAAAFVLVGLSALAVSCVGLSQAEMQERENEARRIMRAKAVHMPPKGVDPCVGVTVRLTEDTEEAKTERALFASRLDEDAVKTLIDAAGLERCRTVYREGVEAGGLSPEVLLLKLGYAVDPDGRVCAVVERQREDPLDSGAIPLIEDVARCAKDVLFAAQFPKGLVKDRERIVRFLALKVEPVATDVNEASGSSGSSVAPTGAAPSASSSLAPSSESAPAPAPEPSSSSASSSVKE